MKKIYVIGQVRNKLVLDAFIVLLLSCCAVVTSYLHELIYLVLTHSAISKSDKTEGIWYLQMWPQGSNPWGLKCANWRQWSLGDRGRPPTVLRTDASSTVGYFGCYYWDTWQHSQKSIASCCSVSYSVAPG